MTKRELINKLEALDIEDGEDVVIELRTCGDHDFEILGVGSSVGGHVVITVIT
jgi:hypothetical protein